MAIRVRHSIYCLLLGLPVAALLVLSSGCLHTKHAVPPNLLAQRWRPQPVPPGPNGLYMDIVHVERPFADLELNRDLWATADDEPLDLATRTKLEQRGFRVAVLGGQLPGILQTLFSEEELNERNGLHLQVQALTPNQIQTSGLHEDWPVESDDPDVADATILANAVGTLRIIPRLTADGSVDLVITPEIQHGEPRRQFVPTMAAGGPLDWSIQVGRLSRLFEDLTFTVRLRAGQYALLSCLPADRQSFGSRFFTRIKDGQTYQRVFLIEAEPSQEARAARTTKL